MDYKKKYIKYKNKYLKLKYEIEGGVYGFNWFKSKPKPKLKKESKLELLEYPDLKSVSFKPIYIKFNNYYLGYRYLSTTLTKQLFLFKDDVDVNYKQYKNNIWKLYNNNIITSWDNQIYLSGINIENDTRNNKIYLKKDNKYIIFDYYDETAYGASATEIKRKNKRKIITNNSKNNWTSSNKYIMVIENHKNYPNFSNIQHVFEKRPEMLQGLVYNEYDKRLEEYDNMRYPSDILNNDIIQTPANNFLMYIYIKFDNNTYMVYDNNTISFEEFQSKTNKITNFKDIPTYLSHNDKQVYDNKVNELNIELSNKVSKDSRGTSGLILSVYQEPLVKYKNISIRKVNSKLNTCDIPKKFYWLLYNNDNNIIIKTLDNKYYLNDLNTYINIDREFDNSRLILNDHYLIYDNETKYKFKYQYETDDSHLYYHKIENIKVKIKTNNNEYLYFNNSNKNNHILEVVVNPVNTSQNNNYEWIIYYNENSNKELHIKSVIDQYEDEHENNGNYLSEEKESLKIKNKYFKKIYYSLFNYHYNDNYCLMMGHKYIIYHNNEIKVTDDDRIINDNNKFKIEII